jgi:hypothetical protein
MGHIYGKGYRHPDAETVRTVEQASEEACPCHLTQPENDVEWSVLHNTRKNRKGSIGLPVGF